jgi:hypothetical protein
MNEQFHTEDCGISLICRCCRGPVCKRYLSRTDRLRCQRDLWPDGTAHERLVATTGNSRVKIFTHFARWARQLASIGTVNSATKRRVAPRRVP